MYETVEKEGNTSGLCKKLSIMCENKIVNYFSKLSFQTCYVNSHKVWTLVTKQSLMIHDYEFTDTSYLITS